MLCVASLCRGRLQQFGLRHLSMQDLANQVDQAIACEMPADSAEVQISIRRPEKLSAAWLALQILQEADVSLQILSEKLLQGLLVDNQLPVKADLGSSSTVKWIKAVRQEESDEQTSIHQALKSILDFVGGQFAHLSILFLHTSLL